MIVERDGGQTYLEPLVPFYIQSMDSIILANRASVGGGSPAETYRMDYKESDDQTRRYGPKTNGSPGVVKDIRSAFSGFNKKVEKIMTS